MAYKFYQMQQHPRLVKDETFSETVLIYDQDDDDYFDMGFYDFEEQIWCIFGSLSFKMICWCYAPRPDVKSKNYLPEKHKGYC